MPLPRPRSSLPLALLVAAVAGCAAPVERHALEQLEQRDVVHVAEVLEEVHLAIAAVERYYAGDAGYRRLGMALDEAVVTLTTTHADTGDGTLALVLPSLDEEGDSDASSTLELHLAAPRAGTPTATLEAAQASQVDALLAAYHRDSQSRCEHPDSVPRQPRRERKMWESITHVAIGAVDGYLCALRRSGATAAGLKSFSVTIGIGTEHTETEGLTLTVGTVSAGATATEKGTSESKLALKFKPR